MVTRSIFTRMPKRMVRRILAKSARQRLQVSFLPLVEDTGTAKIKYQAILHKTLAIHKQRAEQDQSGPGDATVAV